MICETLASPSYLRSLWKHGQPRFGNLKPYTAANADVNQVAGFVRREMGGTFTWEEIARYRELLGVDHFIMRCQWPGLPQEQVLSSIRRLGEIFAS